MPINPLAPTLKVVRCNTRYCDPALDLDAMDLDKYRTSRDPESVKAKSGETPTWFVLRRLKAAMQLEVLDGLDDMHFSTLTSEDVVRHSLVAKIVDAYSRHDEKLTARKNTK